MRRRASKSSGLSVTSGPDTRDAAGGLADRIALFVLAAVAVAALLTFQDYGLGWDDYTHSQYGDLLLALFSSGFRDTRALHFVNLYAYGGGFDMASALAAKILPFDLFDTRRLIGAVVGLIGLGVTWRLARRVGGPLAGPICGLCALLLLATCPLYIGHMFMNAKDAPFAVAMTVLVLSLIVTVEHYPLPPRRSVIFLGLGLGLAFGTRILAVLAIPPALAALALIVTVEARRQSWRAARGDLLRFVGRIWPAAAIGYALMALLWPWSVVDPLNPIRAAFYFDTFFEKPWRELYEGKLVSVPNMPATYLPHLMALKLPEIMLALGIAGTLIALIAVVRRRDDVRRRAALLIVLLTVFLPVAIAMVTHPAFYNGVRHFIFIVPAFAVLGGLAGGKAFDAARRHGIAAKTAAIAVFVAALALPASDIVRLHPFEYTAFNRIGGGVRGARSQYMLDYWGLAMTQASDALREMLDAKHEQPPAGRRWIVAVCGPQRGPQVALGPQFETTAESRGADFAIMLGEFYCRKLDAPLIANIEREGVSFARVYDLRGRTVRNLLTMPPP